MQDKAVDRRLQDVEIPLKNLEFTIQEYLMAHGARLDTQTRVLLAGIRDCVGSVATSGGARNVSVQHPMNRYEPQERLAS